MAVLLQFHILRLTAASRLPDEDIIGIKGNSSTSNFQRYTISRVF